MLPQRTLQFAAIGALLVFTLGCGVVQARTVGEREAERFQQLFDEGSYATIYQTAGPEFQQAGAEEQWIASCREIKRILGPRKKSILQKDSPVLLVDSGGYVVLVAIETEFASGPAIERLAFFVNAGKASLRGYNIDSPAFQERTVPQPNVTKGSVP